MSQSPTHPPDYDELADALRDADFDLSPAEVHGMITGAVSVPQARVPGSLFFGRNAVTATPEVESFLRLVAALQADVLARLQGADFEFQPLLPGAAAELSEQVEALAAWARGYLLGLAASGAADPKRLRGEVSEFLLDLNRISEAEMDDDEPVERQEREIADIVEYLRAGAQLVFDELRG
ncbi:MAG TPA: UPF0149 family protein [Burkholderiales bacterium]|nr:UPF0149 family protein [Burkholderiales bacterium]